jgi:hypothetical protein
MAKDKHKSGKKEKKDKERLKKKARKEDKESKKKKAKKKAAKKARKREREKSRPSTAIQPAPPTISREERLEMIRVAAYYLAQKRAHPGSSEFEDWISAELEIDEMISRGVD